MSKAKGIMQFICDLVGIEWIAAVKFLTLIISFVSFIVISS
jgi:hypothetical protein